MALTLWGWSLNSLPPPRKPTEAGGDQDLPPVLPVDEDLHVQLRLSNGCEPLLLDGGETCRQARMDTGEFGVPSLETRQSYFSNSMPKRGRAPCAPQPHLAQPPQGSCREHDEGRVTLPPQPFSLVAASRHSA